MIPGQILIPAINSISHTKRPFWSVIIPTYNCAKYLEQTLKSVLEQDPGPEEMQIEVVDDCSTKDDPEAVVREIGKGRVSFFRQPNNVGISANWTTCINRAKGHWVHILHGDDTVMPGFYKRLREALEKEPAVGASFCRQIYMDEEGNKLLSSRLERETPGILENWLEQIAVSQLIQTPAIVVKRSVYEQLGGFHPELSHAADWEMWKRIAVHYPVWYEPQPLACYRQHSSSDTSRIITTGANIADTRKAIEISASYLPKAIATDLSNKAREFYAFQAIIKAHQILARGNTAAAIAQIREGLKCSHSSRVIRELTFLLTTTESQPLLESLTSLLLSSDNDQILALETAMFGNNRFAPNIEFELSDINLIIFPNWQYSEESLYEDLATVLKSVINHPEHSKITLLIEKSSISDEDANLIISDILLNLLEQENFEVAEELKISIIGNLSEMQWNALLQKIHARIVLNHENKQFIKEVGAENLPIFNLETLETQILTDSTMSLDVVLSQIQSLPKDWHTGGALSEDVLQAIISYTNSHQIIHSVETGSGASTLLLSHISRNHKVFSFDCGSNGLTFIRSSPILNRANVEFIEGPTQCTLPQYKFKNKLQLALIDGPHAYPFPDLEYYFIYPYLEENALLILDDIHIPNIYNIFVFLKEDNMFELLIIVGNTAFFRRTSVSLFNPFEDGWSLQNYNKNRFPVQVGMYLYR